MTILTPTSKPSETSDVDEVVGGYGQPSAFLPDEASMNRMAGEFFSRIPGAAQMVSHFLPGLGGAPVPSGSGSMPVGSLSDTAVPALDPISSATGAPQTPEPAIAQGVPVAYAAALPQSGAFPQRLNPQQTGAATPVQPFYFLAEIGTYSSSDQGLDVLADQANPKASQSVIAQSFGMPGQDQLQGLLANLYPASATPTVGPSFDRGNASSFYFQQDKQDREDSYSYWDTAPRLDQQGQIAHPPFDVNAIRKDFPILSERVNGRPLVWFDNAATTQKPQSVIDRLAYFYAHENSNIHRAAHELAARATDAYEGARNKVASFLGAASPNEIIFVRGATEAINLVAQTFGKKFIGAGDEIIVSQLEHHANIVPWQQLAAEKGAKIRVIPVDDSGQILLDEFRKLLNDRTKLVSVTQVSNALGTVTPVKEIIEIAHRAGAKVLIDGAQAVSHLLVNVQALDADFYVFSGHKIFGPTGIGVVYGKQALLDQLPPWQGGGNMIADVTFERTQYQDAPARFEAGTGNIADAVGLGAAIDYVQRLGLENIALYEHALLEYATQGLKGIPGVRLIGTANNKASVASFVLAGYQTEEVGKALNQEGIAVRSGHHCAQPILRRFGVEATVRPSFAFYNTCEEIDRMLAVVRRLASARK